MIWRFRVVLTLILVSIAAASFAVSGKIVGSHGLRVVSRLTGTPSLNNTTVPYDIGGTDLGIPIYHNGKTYFLYGDTFSGEDSTAGGNWRRNTVSWSTDASPSDGIVFDSFAVDATGKAKQTFVNNAPSGVITNIPSGGISVNGYMYAWFQNVSQWGPAGGEWYISQAELARWDETNDNFVYVSGSSFAGNGNFGMVAAREGVAGDPYIYLFGTAAGRWGNGVKLARFLPSQIETRSAYRFYDGTVNGVPQWTSDEFAGDFVVSGSTGEMSVMYNQAVGAWTMLYFNEVNDKFEIRQSDAPWGPWSGPTTVMNSGQCPYGTYGLYAPYMLPQWVENNGRTFYFTMSLWSPYDVYIAKVTLDIAPGGTVAINGGNPYTATRAVTLSLNATDDSGSVSQMRISNDGVFDTESWVSYATTKSWTLTDGDGTKTVYVKFRDSSNNESDAVQDSIILYTAPPVIGSIDISPHLAAAGDNVHVCVNASDPAGVAWVTADGVELTKTGDQTWEGSLTALSQEGPHSVAITASDGVGHSSSNTSAYMTAPVYATTARNLAHAIISDAASRVLFTVWGRVTIVDANSFDLQDGSANAIHVTAPGYSGIEDGDFALVRGIVTPGLNPSLTAEAEHVRKVSD